MAETAVFERWLAGEQPQTVGAIASEIGVSESLLRAGGCPRGCEVVARDFAIGHLGGYYRATCWRPSDDGLRARFAAMVERLRTATEGTARDRAELEARG